MTLDIKQDASERATIVKIQGMPHSRIGVEFLMDRAFYEFSKPLDRTHVFAMGRDEIPIGYLTLQSDYLLDEAINVARRERIRREKFLKHCKRRKDV